jgi:hypothetical protein
MNNKKHEIDLVKDIKLNNEFDYVDDYRKRFGGYSGHLTQSHEVDEALIDGSSFSACNEFHLKNALIAMGDTCRTIVEIGVDRNGGRTSTRTILDNKHGDALYLGIDVENKSHLNNPANNVHTLQMRSENTVLIINELRRLGKGSIDFLFIDGWHSIVQVCADWELTTILSKHGVVGFHDTAYHPGPHLFVKNLNRTKWDVIENACSDNANDYGIGFATGIKPSAE